MKVLIVENELLVANYLDSILTEMGHEVIGTAQNIAQAELLLLEKPDMVLLDIFLSDGDNGIDFSYSLNKARIPFLYITANNSSETLVLAVKTKPAGYISKPFNVSDVQAALALIAQNKEQAESYLDLKTTQGILKLKEDDVVYVEANQVYVNIYTLDKKYTERKTLKEITEIVKSETFVRVHRSYLVNTKYISSISSTHIYLKQHKVPYSRTYKEVVETLK